MRLLSPVRILHTLCLFLVIALALVPGGRLGAPPALAQSASAPVILEPAVTYLLGDYILFQARLESVQVPQSGQVYFEMMDAARTWSGELVFNATEHGQYQIEYLFQPAQQGLRTFSEIQYSFEVQFQGGEMVRSQPASFRYDDNRFPWQTRSEAPFHVHWYQDDPAVAQLALDAAQAGLERAASLLPVSTPERVDMYLYANGADLQATLANSPEWIAGHAATDLGVIVVSLPAGPEQSLLIQQRIPHELMHILVYNATGIGYRSLPTWLNEGLASNAELFPNPDYLQLLNKAYAGVGLLPMSELCQSFPMDASSAVLAYAESAYFTRYLHTTHGASSLQSMVEKYADGLGCDAGALAVLGLDLAELERGWRQELFGEQPFERATTNLLPWALLLAAALAAPLILIIGALRRRPRPAPR